MKFFENCYPKIWGVQHLAILKKRREPCNRPYQRRFLLIFCLFFSLVITTRAATTQVSLSLKAVSLQTAFGEIEKQTGYGFWYEQQDLANLPKISVEVKSATLNEALALCMKGLPLSYQLFDQTVVVKRKQEAPLKAGLQEILRGKVMDTQTKEPLAGVLVKVNLSNVSAVTDDRGEFTLNLPQGKYELTLQSIGYEALVQHVVVPTPIVLTIGLTASTQALQEVQVNAGYYSVKQRELTGSIARVTATSIAKQPVSNPLQVLQGRVAGVEIQQLTGVPGGGFKVQVRGRNSISSGVDPLYVVDGVIFPSTRLNTANSNTITQDASPLVMINPNDIESIEVLKDADATAIYGSRGANGVILITTRKGKSEALQVNVNIQQGFAQVGHFMPMMDINQYLAMRMEAFANDGLSPGVNDYDVNGIWDKTKNTNWQELLIGGNAGVRQLTASVSGGAKKVSYLLGANHYNEGTVFAGDFGLQRNGLNLNLNLGDSESRLKAVFSANYSTVTSNLMTTDPTTYITMAPNAPDPFDANGKLNWQYNGTNVLLNPMASLHQTIDAHTQNLLGNLALSYRILTNLELKSTFGYNRIGRNELAKRPNITRSPANNPTSANREAQFGDNAQQSWIIEPQLNYHTKGNWGKINALLGMSFQENETSYRNILASNFSSDELMDNIASASAFSIRESTYTNYKYAAMFARFNYSARDRYFVNLTARRDGSSRFGPGKQFANFWAMGAAWIFSEEAWLKSNLSWLSFGKLRASYGLTGNDQITDYGYMQLYSYSGTYQGLSTLNINRIANPDYAWETNKKLEVALEMGFFKERFHLQTAYFRNRSSNQLVGMPVPPSVGTTSVQANMPAIVQNTGLELEASAKLLDGKNWKWQANFNFTLPKNKLVAYPGLESSSNASNYIVGRPLSIFRYYDTYVDSQTGLYAFKDFNGNGLRDDADRYLNTFIGQQYYGGLQNSLQYKGFQFDFLISFVKQQGNSVLNGITYPPGYFAPGVPNVNQPAVLPNRWTAIGDVASMPKYTTLVSGVSNLSLGKSTGAQAIGDASFVRLKQASLAYQLPQSWLAWAKVSGTQLYVQGQNLFTLTGYEGIDPENQLYNRLPPLRTIMFGARLNF